MLIDAHVHVFPPEVREDPAGFGAREPHFGLLYGDGKARMAGGDEMVDALDASSLDRAVVYGFPWLDPDLARRHNEHLLEVAARHPDRLIAGACVHPLARGAVRVAEEALDAGAAVLGEVALYDRDLDDEVLPALEDLVSVCRIRGRPFCLHTNEPVGHSYPGKAPLTLQGLFHFLERAEGHPVILAHWGGGLPLYGLLRRRMKRLLAQVYVDTAASPYLYRPAIYRHVCDILGADRVLAGTDYPLLPWSRYRTEMERAGLSDEERWRICGQNAARLLGLARTRIA